MSRRKFFLLGTAATLCVCLVWLFRSAVFDLWPPAIDYGSQYILKGPQAEDKVIVMAKMEAEDVSWVAEELPE